MVYVILGILGLCLGSFVNALVWRLHEQELETAKHRPNKKYLRQLSISKGRSLCPACRHELAAWDLIPVISWLWLKGRCRYCQTPISWQYPAVELIAPLIMTLSYVYWPLPLRGVGLLEFVVWLVVVIGFLALAVYDLRWFVLPSKIVYPLIGLALVQLLVVASFYHGGAATLLGALWGILVAAGIFYVLFQISKGTWVGGGDVKLGVVIGLLLGGPLMSILMLFIASMVGSIVALPLLATGRARAKSRLPFGPFLIVATVIVRLFGAAMIVWYKRQYAGM